MLGLAGWFLFTCLAAISGAVTAKTAAAFYAQLEKPRWAPPAWAFGPTWSVLYTMMSIAAWTVWRDHGFGGATFALGCYVVQLALNALWSWLFFVKRTGRWATYEAAMLWIGVATTLVAFWERNPSAGILFIPYLAWVSVATALAASVWRRNPTLLGES